MTQSQSDFDAIVFSEAPVGIVDGIYYYNTLSQAVVEGRTSILMKNGGDDVATVTIVATDAVTRIQGISADVVPLATSVVCNKTDVTFEQLNIPSGMTLTLAGARCIAKDMLISGTGKLQLTGVGSRADKLRAFSCTGIPVEIGGAVVTVADPFFYNCSGANCIGFIAASAYASIYRSRFEDNNCSGPEINAIGYDMSYVEIDGLVSQNGTAINGVIAIRADIVMLQNIRHLGNLGSGKIGIDIQEPSTAVCVAYLNNVYIEALAGTALDYTGTTVPQSFRFANISSAGGAAVKGVQNAQWTNLQLWSGGVLNLASKTGQTITGGELTGITPSNIPTDLRSIGVHGFTDRGIPTASVTHASAQSIATATFTAVAFDTERFDNDAIHDTSTNNTRLTCKTAGKYIIIFNGEFVASVLGTARFAKLVLNGTTDLAVSPNGPILAGFAGVMHVSREYELAVNDYVEVQVYQDSGAGLNLDKTGNRSPEFSMARVG